MRSSLVALALIAAACAPQAAPPPSAPGTADNADTCGMANWRQLIGAEASTIDRSTLPLRTRVITPDMMVTQDYSAERLNIIVGTDGRVGSLRCF
ncbi:MAG: I78 family peptidase inhibitor [Hyphomonadaceae bacterium]